MEPQVRYAPGAKPGVGRIVHYIEAGKCQAAIVTDVTPQLPPGVAWVDPVALTVFPGARDLATVSYDPDGHGGTWHWPERVE